MDGLLHGLPSPAEMAAMAAASLPVLTSSTAAVDGHSSATTPSLSSANYLNCSLKPANIGPSAFLLPSTSTPHPSSPCSSSSFSPTASVLGSSASHLDFVRSTSRALLQKYLQPFHNQPSSTTELLASSSSQSSCVKCPLSTPPRTGPTCQPTYTLSGPQSQQMGSQYHQPNQHQHQHQHHFQRAHVYTLGHQEACGMHLPVPMPLFQPQLPLPALALTTSLAQSSATASQTSAYPSTVCTEPTKLNNWTDNGTSANRSAIVRRQASSFTDAQSVGTSGVSADSDTKRRGPIQASSSSVSPSGTRAECVSTRTGLGDARANGTSSGGMGEVGGVSTLQPGVRACPGSPVRRPYTEAELSAAVRAICFGRLGTRRAASVYGIPRSTLRNKICKLNELKRREEERMGGVQISMAEFLRSLVILPPQQLHSLPMNALGNQQPNHVQQFQHIQHQQGQSHQQHHHHQQQQQQQVSSSAGSFCDLHEDRPGRVPSKTAASSTGRRPGLQQSGYAQRGDSLFSGGEMKRHHTAILAQTASRIASVFQVICGFCRSFSLYIFRQFREIHIAFAETTQRTICSPECKKCPIKCSKSYLREI
ncbi:unnamed protein product [Protopolystoma xenopodis]|uniref:HTH psq-type domain-containing protein n=1 Tax=Protopolystoma xenopodis TaxID=117903 RepID=A0A3S4ZKD9_9PLAT|nr:unnamed protein product [Protopolystoma xenopodis]